MRHTGVYAGNSGQSRAGSATHLDVDFGNDNVDAERVDKHWGDNERLGNHIDGHYRNHNNRINDGWFYDGWCDKHNID